MCVGGGGGGGGMRGAGASVQEVTVYFGHGSCMISYSNA